MAKNVLEELSNKNTIEDNINQFIKDINEKLEITDHNNDSKEILKTVFSVINNYKKQLF